MNEPATTHLADVFCRECILAVDPEASTDDLTEQCLNAMAAAGKIPETTVLRLAALFPEGRSVFWHNHGETAALLCTNTMETLDCAGAAALGVRTLENAASRVRVSAIFLLVSPFEKHEEASEIVKLLARLMASDFGQHVLSHARRGDADQFFGDLRSFAVRT